MKTPWINILNISILIVFIFIFSCDKATKYEEEVTVELKLSEEILNKDEILNGEFTVTNKSPNTKVFHFNSSCQFGFRVTDDDEIEFYKSDGCRASPSKFELLSGESKKFEFKYLLKDFDGNDLPLGNYEITAFLFNTKYTANRTFQIK